MSVHLYPYIDPALIGFVQVQSERGRLLYLPDSIEHVLGLDQAANQSLFQTRGVRPHRIHTARVAAEYCGKSKGKRFFKASIIVEKFGKLAVPKEGARKFFKYIIADNSKPAKESASPEPARKTSPERPTSWAPGAVTERMRRRPTSGLWAEAKRRSFLSTLPESPSAVTNTDPTSETMRPSMRHSIASPVGVATAVGSSDGRPSLADISPPESMSTISRISTPAASKIPSEKPLASGNGISVSVVMAEPCLFLQGFEQGDLASDRSTAMLRGSLLLKVTKPSKVKSVTLRFRGRTTTKWPEGIPPKKTEFEETSSHINHTWPFFNAQFPTAEKGTGADHVRLAASANDLGPNRNRSSVDMFSRNAASNSSTNLTTKDLKRLSMQVNQSRSFGKGESQTGGPTVAQKGYRTFQPGDYMYNFELPLDSHLPETIDADLGSVKYELEAVVERAGAFKANLAGSKEVLVIRTPAEGSLEQVEPIAISRNWEDQLHYDIVISGKSFPLGAQVPIAFKLTPLAKVQCHRIKVFVTESVEYFCNNKRVHRMEPTRKVQLFEKRADSPAVSTFPGSTMRILSGGGVPYDLRAAAARGEEITPPDSTNLLGNLEGGSGSIGPTEMEFTVQLPSCVNMKEKDKSCRLHFDTTYTNIQVHHWIKIVMRLSKPDVNDPTKRRHFEISIDSPFHILSCRATQANMALPAYSSPDAADTSSQLFECGCPGAAPRRNTTMSYMPTLNNVAGIRAEPGSIPGPMSRTDSLGLSRPQAAHIGGPVNPVLQRPMHIIRAPSFNPPAFEDEEPPPPLETPPPQYDTIASPTTGLSDYFARLSDAYDENAESDEEDGQRTPTGTSRVEVPLTPGSIRANRSMDEVRTWPNFGNISLSLPPLPALSRAAQASANT